MDCIENDLSPELRANSRFVLEYAHYQHILDDDTSAESLLQFTKRPNMAEHVKGMVLPTKQYDLLMPWALNSYAEGYFLKKPSTRLVMWLLNASLDAIASDIHCRFTDNARILAMIEIHKDPTAVYYKPSCELKQTYDAHTSVHPCLVDGTAYSHHMPMVCQWLALYFKRVAMTYR